MPKTLRVGFDVSAATSRRPRGIASYILDLLPALARVVPHIEPVLFLRDERWLRRKQIETLVPGAERRWILEPLRAPLRGIDVFHGLGTRLPRSARVRRSFTLHDLRGFDLDPRGPSSDKTPTVPANQTRKAATIERADSILCLTDHGRDRLLTHFPRFERDAVHVVGHGVNLDRFQPYPEAERRALLQRLGIDGPFLLQLGSFFPHKNLEMSLEAFARSEACNAPGGVQLVFAGGGGSEKHRQSLRERSSKLGITDRVLWFDNIDGADLPTLLASAKALLMPSRYEGYGLPILEAMASGVPGVASTAACLPEVSAGIWSTCDPDDPVAWSAAIDRLVTDDAARDTAIAEGLDYARSLTWDRCAMATAEFLVAAAAH